MIYSIGYRGLKIAELLRTAIELDAVIVDTRGTPNSRNPSYRKGALQKSLGERYDWRGTELGNHGTNHVTEAGISRLGHFAFPGAPNAILMCMCHAPGDCHRHKLIARPLLARGIDVHHLYEDQIVLASELQRAIDDGDDYAFTLRGPALAAEPDSYCVACSKPSDACTCETKFHVSAEELQS